jgi:hypothetical protein
MKSIGQEIVFDAVLEKRWRCLTFAEGRQQAMIFGT